MSGTKEMSILVRMPGSLSDMVESLPIFKALRRKYPNAHIAALIKTKYKQIFSGYSVDEVIGFDKKPRFAPVLESGEDVISYLQKREFDLGIILPYSFSSAYIFYIGMVKRRIGFARPFGCFMLTDRVEPGEYKDLLKPLEIELSEEESRPRLYAEKKHCRSLHVGLSVRFDLELLSMKWYKEIISFLLSELPYVKITLLSRHEHLKEVEELVSIRPESIDYSAKKTLLKDKMDTIHSLDVFISENEGLLALAKGLQTPFVNLQGLIENEQLLPEDFFSHIRKAILEPLKAQSSMRSYGEFYPITQGSGLYSDFFPTKKRVGVIILAGGMGRRLGLDKPKGLLEVGGRCLYDILTEKAKDAERVGILTSPMTIAQTKEYCKGKGIDIFHKKVYPTEEGYGVSPEGNGALFEALVYSEHWEKWKELDVISVVAVDNPKADPMDRVLLSSDKELAVIGVERDRKEEKLGVLCERAKKLAVREYFTLGKEGMEGLGYSGSFAATPAFFEKVAEVKLPFYRVEKKNQVFYERLLIDGFSYAESFDVVRKDRAECFYPIKEKRDLLALSNVDDLEGVKK